jgi:hypothetical protein
MTLRTLYPLPIKRKPDENDRRRSGRVRHVVDAWIASPTDFDRSDGFEAKSLNVSRHGVGFETARELPAGSFWVIEIAMGEQQMSSEVRIVSCHAIDGGKYEIGAEFC